jgi:DNA repair protein RadC
LHNHPSGNPEPSREDIEITRKIVESGKIIGIPVLDHIIIADRDFTSFADRQLI